METITLTNGNLVKIDASDLDKVFGYRWNQAVYGYAMAYIGGKNVLMHRLIVDAPKGKSVDHKNGDPTDNRRQNLRLCSHSENMANRKLHKNNTSGYKGVYWDKTARKWCVAIKKNNIVHRLGRFRGLQEAALAYEEKAKQLFGTFYRPTKG